ncbi:Uncharacterised protein [Klebsiella pneumoniae]|nr:Uncharacterised protein [Klebsiella pneumoniae]
MGDDLTQGVIQTAGRQHQRLTADFTLAIREQPRRAEGELAAAQGAGLIADVTARAERQGVTGQQVTTRVADRAGGVYRQRRLGFYRAVLIVQTAGVKPQVAVAAHLAARIVEQATDSPLLRRAIECQQAAARVGQRRRAETELAAFNGAVTVVQPSRQREATFTRSRLGPGGLLVEQVVRSDVPAAGLHLSLARINIPGGVDDQLFAVYRRISQRRAALPGVYPGAAGRDVRAADVDPASAHLNLFFTEQAAAGANIALALQAQAGLAVNLAVGIAARQQVPAARYAASGVELHITRRGEGA